MACIAAGSALLVGCSRNESKIFNINKGTTGSRMRLNYFPYELQLRHTFTVATSSRTTTQGVQLEIEYEGLTGYGEASMPPYLQKELGTVESVIEFFGKAAKVLERYDDPTRLEDILAEIDTLSEGNAAAKAAIDIALHDLVGKMLGAPWYKIWG
jgi:L-alanine-DL-glutamate epimerase-like enolase superfamily enzyme